MASQSAFWKPGSAAPPAQKRGGSSLGGGLGSPSAPSAARTAGKGLSVRATSMRFMVRGADADVQKKAEGERKRAEAASQWVLQHGPSVIADSGLAAAELSAGHAAGLAPPVLRVRTDNASTFEAGSDSAAAIRANGAAWSGRVSFRAFNKGLESTVRAACAEESAVPSVDETQMAEYFAGRTGGGGGGGVGGRKRAREEGEGDDGGREGSRFLKKKRPREGGSGARKLTSFSGVGRKGGNHKGANNRGRR